MGIRDLYAARLPAVPDPLQRRRRMLSPAPRNCQPMSWVAAARRLISPGTVSCHRPKGRPPVSANVNHRAAPLCRRPCSSRSDAPKPKITVWAYVSRGCHDHPQRTHSGRRYAQRVKGPLRDMSRIIASAKHLLNRHSHRSWPTLRFARASPLKPPTYRSTTAGPAATRKPYARTGEIKCQDSVDTFMKLNTKGELRWPFTMSGRRDSNPRPLDPQSSALPSCATSRSHRRNAPVAGTA